MGPGTGSHFSIFSPFFMSWLEGLRTKQVTTVQAGKSSEANIVIFGLDTFYLILGHSAALCLCLNGRCAHHMQLEH